jgi:hypothetical protein
MSALSTTSEGSWLFFAECVGDLQAQMPQQGGKLRVQFTTNSCDSGIGVTTELIARLVYRKESLPIGTAAPYRSVKWRVHYDGWLIPKHPFHDYVVSHEISDRRVRIACEAHDPIDVIRPINEKTPWCCPLDEIHHFPPRRASAHQFAHLNEWERRDGIFKL